LAVPFRRQEARQPPDRARGPQQQARDRQRRAPGANRGPHPPPPRTLFDPKDTVVAFGDMAKRSPLSGRLVAVLTIRPVATRKVSCTRASGWPWAFLTTTSIVPVGSAVIAGRATPSNTERNRTATIPLQWSDCRRYPIKQLR
jgi:hypothetical protein